MGGQALTLCGPSRSRLVLLGALLLFLPACVSGGYRNDYVPALVAPSSPSHVADDRPTRVSRRESLQLEGGIRLIRSDLARLAPAFSLTDQNGVVHSSASTLGRVVWVDLWAVWCGTCRAEFPFVQRMHERFERNGLTILGVCRNSERDGFLQASVKDWLDFPVVDASRDRNFPFPYRAFPTTVLIDRAGRVRGYWQGHRTPEAMEDALRFLLGEPTPPGVIAARRAAGTYEHRPLPTSAKVLSAELKLPREGVPAGGYFEGTVTLDVDPGWFLCADREEGLIPLDLRFTSADGFLSLGHLVPRPTNVVTATGDRRGHAGRILLPVWGLVDRDAPAGRLLRVELVATLQACDRTQCLAPSEVRLIENLWVADSETPQ